MPIIDNNDSPYKPLGELPEDKYPMNASPELKAAIDNNDSRKAFEVYCKSIGRGHAGTELPYQGLYRRHDGNYNDALIQGYWSAWQACEQRFLKMLESEEMGEYIAGMLRDEGFLSEHETYHATATIKAAIRQKLGLV